MNKLTKRIVLFSVGISLFASLAGNIWVWYQTHYDYNQVLTGKVYRDTIEKNVNIVFYKDGCSSCELAKKAVVKASHESKYPTYFVEVNSPEGKKLVREYKVDLSSTVTQIRKGKVKNYIYVERIDEKIVADDVAIKQAFE